MSKTPDFTLADFEAMKATDTLLLIDFWAPWCGPCRQATPVFEHLSEQSSLKNIKFVNTNVDNEQELSAQFKITSIPTFLLLKFNKEGEPEVIDTFVGYQDPFKWQPKLEELAGKFGKSEDNNVVDIQAFKEKKAEENNNDAPMAA